MSKDKDLDWIEKSGGFEWTPGSPWPPEVPDEEADSDDTYTVAFDHLMNDVKHSDYYYDYTRNDPDRENPFTDPKDRESLLQRHLKMVKINLKMAISLEVILNFV